MPATLPTIPPLPRLPQVASLRDLANRMLYWRTPLTARWQGVNVSAAAAADGPRILPLFQGWRDAFEDATALVRVPGVCRCTNACVWLQPRIHLLPTQPFGHRSTPCS